MRHCCRGVIFMRVALTPLVVGRVVLVRDSQVARPHHTARFITFIGHTSVCFPTEVGSISSHMTHFLRTDMNTVGTVQLSFCRVSEATWLEKTFLFMWDAYACLPLNSYRRLFPGAFFSDEGAAKGRRYVHDWLKCRIQGEAVILLQSITRG